jgi:hypothetical protein
MKKDSRAFKFMFFIIFPLIFIISLETFSFLYIKIFSKQSTLELSDRIKKNEPLPILSEFTPHPTFTYVSTSPLSNNMGFISKLNYPYIRNENDFVIGVFGGSVADMMSWKSEPLNASEILKKQVPSLRNKNIVILNFASGCAKQPMQYHRFSRFTDDIDLAINIDGFNEIEFNDVGADITSPCMLAMLYTQTAYQLNSNLLLNIIAAESKNLKHRMISSQLFGKSAAFTLVTELVIKIKHSVEYIVVNRLDASNKSGHSKIYPFDFKTDNRDLHILGAKNWAKYARLELAAAKEMNIPILFALQPTILFKGSKPLSTEEVKLDETMLEGGIKRWSSKSDYITKGYQELQSQMDNLKKKNPNNFVDLTGIYSKTQNTIYTDPCCHYNDEGNKLLWTEVAKAVGKLVK